MYFEEKYKLPQSGFKAHTHPISDITGLQTALDNKLNRNAFGGSILYVNPNASGAVDTWTRTQALGNPDRCFLTINAAMNAATSSDIVLIVRGVTITGNFNTVGSTRNVFFEEGSAIVLSSGSYNWENINVFGRASLFVTTGVTSFSAGNLTKCFKNIEATRFTTTGGVLYFENFVCNGIGSLSSPRYVFTGTFYGETITFNNISNNIGFTIASNSKLTLNIRNISNPNGTIYNTSNQGQGTLVINNSHIVCQNFFGKNGGNNVIVRISLHNCTLNATSNTGSIFTNGNLNTPGQLHLYLNNLLISKTGGSFCFTDQEPVTVYCSNVLTNNNALDVSGTGSVSFPMQALFTDPETVIFI